MKYTEYQLIQFAQDNPQELVKIINSQNDMRTVTATVEILSSEVSDEKLVFPVLNKLLKHIHATIREAAMSGVSSFYADKNPPDDILRQLKAIAEHDPSSLLRDYAKDLLSKVE